MRKSWRWLALMAGLFSIASRRGATGVKVGMLLDDSKSSRLLAFEFAVEVVNRMRPELKIEGPSIVLRDTFNASRKVCSFLGGPQHRKSAAALTTLTSAVPVQSTGVGVAALFGPYERRSTVEFVRSLSETFGLPHIEAQLDVSDDDPFPEGDRGMSVNVYPDDSSLSKAMLDFVTAFSWKKLLILYKGSRGLIRMKSILSMGTISTGDRSERLDVLMLEIEDMEKTMKELKYNLQHKHIIVDIPTSDVPQFLRFASLMGVLTTYHHFMFATLDLSILQKEIGIYSMGGVNITGFQLVSPKSAWAKRLHSHWNDSSMARRQRDFSQMLLVDNALVIDSVVLFAEALANYSARVPDFSARRIDCGGDDKASGDRTWEHGRALRDELLRSHVENSSLSGSIQLDKQGSRKELSMELVEYDVDGIVQQMGVWTLSHGLTITKAASVREQEIKKDLLNRTLRVVTRVDEPFVMVRDRDDKGEVLPLGDPRRIYGYCIDMLERIAAHLNITYKIITVEEHIGMELPNGSWTGMIGQIIRGDADLAVSALTITYDRSKVMDFTKPYINLGISILFKKPAPDAPSLFSFLDPLDYQIWLCMLGAYAFVSLFIYVVARFSPYEWKNPHPCQPNFDRVENDFTLLNSFWFTIGSLMQQGSEIAPKASSTRIVAGVWWFFTLIMISSYTANLAAFLTITRMTTPIKNADDLSKQTAIKYGSYFGGSTMAFFKNSRIPTYERMWNFMQHHDDVFVNSTVAGINKVKAGGYAYLMESTTLRYQLSKHCDLMEVGGELDSKGYGIGLPRGSPYRDAISNAILHLSEQQVLLNLYNKWWNVDSSRCKTEVDEQNNNQANQLGLPNLGGVFMFLVGGLCLAFVISLIEFVINSVVNSKADKQTLCSEIREECTFALKCWGPTDKLAPRTTKEGAPCSAAAGAGSVAGEKVSSDFAQPLNGIPSNEYSAWN